MSYNEIEYRLAYSKNIFSLKNIFFCYVYSKLRNIGKDLTKKVFKS